MRFVNWLLPKSWREAVFGSFFIAFVSTIGYLMIIDRQPLAQNDSEILTPVVRQGEDFRISYDVVWNSNCRVTGYRFIVDGAGYRHERLIDTRMVAQGEEQFVISIPVPIAASPGEAEYRGEVEYECNMLQRVFPLRRTLTVRSFQIIAGTPNSSSGISYLQCPAEQPIHVQAHCRAAPRYSLVVD